MTEPFLRSQLEPIAKRRRRFGLARDLAIAWAATAVVALGFLGIYRASGWLATWVLPALVSLGVAATVVVWVRSRRWAPDFRQIARQIEQRHPELHALLLTAVEQQPDPETGKYNYLQERVIKQAIDRSLAEQWIDTVSAQRLFA